MSTIAPPDKPKGSTPAPPPVAHVPTDDDHLPGARRFTARQAVAMILVAFALLVICDGGGIRSQGHKQKPGLERTVLLAVGKPAGWIADQLPFAPAVRQMTGWLSPDKNVASSGGRFTAPAGTGSTRVSPQAIDPQMIGLRPGPKPPLHKVLVTGDSMSQPMDSALARDLIKYGVKTARDPKFGTGISKSDLLDWGKYSQIQVQHNAEDATVVFLGANEGFPMKTATGTVQFGSTAWAAEYASRVRAMMETYLRGGHGRVYWMLIPTASDSARNSILRVVNPTLKLAAAAFGAQVRMIDLPAVLTPGGKFRSAMPVGGRMQIVRDPDGAHLNETGGKIAAGLVEKALAQDFTLGSG